MPDLFDEIHPCVTYYQDKLSSQPLDKIYVACSQDPPAAVLSSLSERFRSPVLSLDPLRFFQSPNAAALRTFQECAHAVAGPGCWEILNDQD